MTGPTYPPGPAAGSNAIGSFTIGVSPIGSIPAFDIEDTIISQYANSPIIVQLMKNLGAYLDLTKNFDDFFDMIWNIATAQGYGLDVWGIIIGVSRTLQIQNSGIYAGFEEQVPTVDTFGPGGQSPFYSGDPVTSNFNLSDGSYRTLLYAKALTNITDCSIPAINQILLNLFPNRGDCYVTDGENMTMTYTFKFALTPVEIAIVSASGVLPKPAGVAATVVQIF